MMVARRATPPTAGIQPQGVRYPQVSLLCTRVSWNGCGAEVATGDSGDAAGMAAGAHPPSININVKRISFRNIAVPRS